LMVKRTFVIRSTDKLRLREEQLSRWGTWNPAAGFFHLATKDVQYGSGQNQLAASREKARTEPVPPSAKPLKRGAVSLPPATIDGVLPSVLLQRRTWRRFSRRAVAASDIATLLQLTWGVHSWIEVPAVGRFALKTSPSGGARHSVEVYVLARNVAGLRPGLYHYHPDSHQLAPLGRSRTPRVTDYVPGQQWFEGAAALLLMTAVFDRVQWRYPHARAYRAVMAEAGHLCQTFCLVATWLGLAPFCTMALADSRIERDLSIDGVSESVIYAAGVGARPKGVDWAPWPGSDRTPLVTAPSHAGRKRSRVRA
jgi:SagB-type dehydrogenase family enzyme